MILKKINSNSFVTIKKFGEEKLFINNNKIILPVLDGYRIITSLSEYNDFGLHSNNPELDITGVYSLQDNINFVKMNDLNYYIKEEEGIPRIESAFRNPLNKGDIIRTIDNKFILGEPGIEITAFPQDSYTMINKKGELLMQLKTGEWITFKDYSFEDRCIIDVFENSYPTYRFFEIPLMLFYKTKEERLSHRGELSPYRIKDDNLYLQTYTLKEFLQKFIVVDSFNANVLTVVIRDEQQMKTIKINSSLLTTYGGQFFKVKRCLKTGVIEGEFVFKGKKMTIFVPKEVIKGYSFNCIQELLKIIEKNEKIELTKLQNNDIINNVEREKLAIGTYVNFSFKGQELYGVITTAIKKSNGEIQYCISWEKEDCLKQVWITPQQIMSVKEGD